MHQKNQQEQLVNQLINFVDRNKHEEVRAVFQTEKIGEQLGPEVKSILVKAMYGTIHGDDLRYALHNALEPNIRRYSSAPNRIEETTILAQYRPTARKFNPREPVEVQPLRRIKIGHETKPNPMKEFIKTVVEGLGLRIPSPTAIVETAPYVAHTIQAIKNKNQMEYLRWAEMYGYGEFNPFHDRVSPEFREMAKKVW